MKTVLQDDSNIFNQLGDNVIEAIKKIESMRQRAQDGIDEIRTEEKNEQIEVENTQDNLNWIERDK